MKELKELGTEGITVDPEELVQTIDIEAIDDEAIRLAMEMVNNLSDVYFDSEFMKENPSLKKRIDFGIESMRILIKMRKSSEQTHDLLINSIASTPNNASLYRAQAQIEGNLLNIQKQMDDTINSLNNLMKGYQLEINFRNGSKDTDLEEPAEQQSIHRGSKSFIQQMRDKQEQNADSLQTELAFSPVFEEDVDQED